MGWKEGKTIRRKERMKIFSKEGKKKDRLGMKEVRKIKKKVLME